MGGGERAQKKEGPAKGRDRTESHNKEYKKRRAQKRESAQDQGWVVSEIRVQFVFAPGVKSVGCPKLD